MLASPGRPALAKLNELEAQLGMSLTKWNEAHRHKVRVSHGGKDRVVRHDPGRRPAQKLVLTEADRQRVLILHSQGWGVDIIVKRLRLDYSLVRQAIKEKRLEEG
jgi:hypothetical protein